MLDDLGYQIPQSIVVSRELRLVSVRRQLRPDDGLDHQPLDEGRRGFGIQPAHDPVDDAADVERDVLDVLGRTDALSGTSGDLPDRDGDLYPARAGKLLDDVLLGADGDFFLVEHQRDIALFEVLP